MRKVILALLSLALLAITNVVNAYTVQLVTHNQRSGEGTLSTLAWRDCGTGPYAVGSGCVNPNSPSGWEQANGVTPSTATWDWNPVTQVMTSTGRYETTSHLSSNPNGSSVIDDRVTDLVMDIPNASASASAYQCIEGNFLTGVGANACANVNIGANFTYDSTVVYNVGLVTNCVTMTFGGDDYSLDDGSAGPPVVQGTALPRGLTVQTTDQAGVGCNATSGAFDLTTVDTDTSDTLGGQLIITNGICLFSNPPVAEPDAACAGGNYMTFVPVPDAVDDGPIAAPPTGSISIPVMANDNVFTDPVTVTIAQQAVGGTATVVGSPGPQSGISITYTAGGTCSAADSFQYTVVDNVGATDTATVTTSALPATASTRLNTAVVTNVGANICGFNTPTTVTITVAPDHGGTATPSAPGAPAGQSITFTPSAAADAPNYTETFTYEISDGAQTLSSQMTVTVYNVVAGDDPAPGVTISTLGVAPDQVSTGNTFNAATFAGNSLGDAGVVTATDGATGTATVPVGSNVITYTPNANFFTGTDSFTYTITDPVASDTGTVAVTILDVTPTLADGSITTTAGVASPQVPLVITYGNGSQAQNPVTVSTQAANGSCAVLGAGTTVQYTPSAGFSGGDSCVLTITDEDGAGQSDTGTFSVTVSGGGGGGGGGPQLPAGGSSSLDLWSLSLLAGVSWLRRRRDARGNRE